MAGGERLAAARQLRGLGQPPDPGANALQRLIQGRLRERGWSYGLVARRGGLPRSTVYKLATNYNLARPPQLETIEKLARGLELPASALRTAAAEATGLRLYRGSAPSEETASFIASLEELTSEDRRVVASLIEALRRTAAVDDHTRGAGTSSP